MEARSQVQRTTKANEMNFIPNLTAFSWKAMQRTQHFEDFPEVALPNLQSAGSLIWCLVRL